MQKAKKDKAVKVASDKKAKEAAKDPKVTLGKTGSEWLYYVSAKEEPVKWELKLAGESYRGKWNTAHTHVVWRIPAKLKDRMERHVHFTNGRIIAGGE